MASQLTSSSHVTQPTISTQPVKIDVTEKINKRQMKYFIADLGSHLIRIAKCPQCKYFQTHAEKMKITN